MIVKLSDNTEVTLKDKLKYKDTINIQKAMFEGVKVNQKADVGVDASNMFESTLKAIELTIQEIKKDGNVIPYTREWLEELDSEDGMLLQEKVNEVQTKKK